MEAFESFVAIALESEGLVVSSSVKFDVAVRTAKAAYDEIQTHGYEVDLIGARAGRLVLASVKSYLGSRGVVAEHVIGETDHVRFRKLYALLNDEVIRQSVIAGAADRYGYALNQVELRLYVGKFAAPSVGHHEQRIRAWAETQLAGAGPIRVSGLDEVVAKVRTVAQHKQYRDNPALMAVKVLEAAGTLAQGHAADGDG